MKYTLEISQFDKYGGFFVSPDKAETVAWREIINII